MPDYCDEAWRVYGAVVIESIALIFEYMVSITATCDCFVEYFTSVDGIRARAPRPLQVLRAERRRDPNPRPSHTSVTWIPTRAPRTTGAGALSKPGVRLLTASSR